MRKIVPLALTLTFSFSLTSCNYVKQSSFEELETKYDSLEQQYNDLKDKVESLETITSDPFSEDVLKNYLDKIEAEATKLKSEIELTTDWTEEKKNECEEKIYTLLSSLQKIKYLDVLDTFEEKIVDLYNQIYGYIYTLHEVSSNVSFWTPFGAKYRNVLNNVILPGVEDDLGLKINHESKGSYPNIREAIVDSVANSSYPDLLVGYPDHFAQYQGSNILVPLDGKIDTSDYYQNYLPENYLYDTNGNKTLYSVPFYKATEVLGYNGVFVDYCAAKYDDLDLKNLPKTWDEWASTDPNSKVQKYKTAFTELINCKSKLCGKQRQDGEGYDFKIELSPTEGRKVLIDYTQTEAFTARLFSWDETDNAFITLVKQWGAEYTKVPESEKTVHPKNRKGHVLFANSTNLPKVKEMLRFFYKMYTDEIFTTPSLTLGADYSADAFEEGRCMFMVCSKNDFSFNTERWENRLSIAPIPYKDAAHKYVMSLGGNIGITRRADEEKAIEVLKALTTGKSQTEWAIQTGYFPASNSSAASPEYQAFLDSADYSDPTRVANREAARVNESEYKSKGWTSFVDDAFIGSAIVREKVAQILGDLFAKDNASDETIESVLNNVLNHSDLRKNTIEIER